MGRVRQCPYKTSFLCYFFRMCNVQILGNFVLTDATTSATDVKKYSLNINIGSFLV
jgi:hypothetical protein